jgi:hypothetical protein
MQNPSTNLQLKINCKQDFNVFGYQPTQRISLYQARDIHKTEKTNLWSGVKKIIKIIFVAVLLFGQ